VLLASTITDSLGHYFFAGLAAANNQRQFVAPTNYQFSAQNQGPDEALDSDADSTTGYTAVFGLTLNQNRTDLDAVLLLQIGEEEEDPG
jgi:hypothetical protein